MMLRMKTICSLLVLTVLSFTAAFAEPTVADSLNGKLVSVKNKKFSSYDAKQLADTKYFAVYFSALWCPPCRAFTPKLVEFYNRVKPAHPEFELIFVSRDNSEDSMLEYMNTDSMPWPAVRFSKLQNIKNLNKYAGGGIPFMVFIDASGEILSNSEVDGKYVGPGKVMNDIEAKLNSSK
jgi:nucleoredoxin